MTEQERDETIRKINHDIHADDEAKATRIAVVEAAYKNGLAVRAAAVEAQRNEAEGLLRSRLRESYLKNPIATEADFENDYPTLRAELLRRDALKDFSQNTGQATSAW